MLPPSPSPVVSILAFVAGVVMLRLNLWRAWLVIKPQSMRLLVEDPGEVRQVPRVLEPTHEALRALGFTSIGSHLEQPRFGAASLIYDYVHARSGVFASLSEAPRWGVRFNRGIAYVPRSEAEGPQARLVLLTPCANDAFVLSANARRPGANLAGRYLSGALPGATVERLFKAHLRRLAEMSAPAARWTIDGRIEAARRWQESAGRKEIRQQHATGLLWAIGALALVAAVFLTPGPPA